MKTSAHDVNSKTQKDYAPGRPRSAPRRRRRNEEFAASHPFLSRIRPVIAFAGAGFAHAAKHLEQSPFAWPARTPTWCDPSRMPAMRASRRHTNLRQPLFWLLRLESESRSGDPIAASQYRSLRSSDDSSGPIAAPGIAVATDDTHSSPTVCRAVQVQRATG
jgi:hypothetical protein